MKVTTHMPRLALAVLAAGAVAAPAAHAGPMQEAETAHGCVMTARTCLTAEQVRQIDMHASTVQAPKGNDVVADVRTEAAKPEQAPPVIKGVPVFPTDTTPIAAPKPQPVATDTGDGDSFDWPLAALIAAAVAAMGGAVFVAGRQVRAHAAH
jgi:hypothetical protein